MAVYALAVDPPLRLKLVPDAAPRTGVTSVGEVASTSAPLPVGVAASAVATPAPSPLTPVLTGKPVAFVNVAAEGVPRFGVLRVGVVKVGELESTTAPLPVEVVLPVPPLATASVPVTPVDNGKPVAFVNVAAEGVPRAGVVKVGDVASTTAPLPVDVVPPVPPLATASVPASVMVPLVVIGPPLVVRPVLPPDTATLVTVPLPPAVDQPAVTTGPLTDDAVRTCPAVGNALGKARMIVEPDDGAVSVVPPVDDPGMLTPLFASNEPLMVVLPLPSSSRLLAPERMLPLRLTLNVVAKFKDGICPHDVPALPTLVLSHNCPCDGTP